MYFDLVNYLDIWLFRISRVNLLSQPNNNHNPNNKTIIIVVGLRQSNRWEPPPTNHHHLLTTHMNSKLYDKAKIEQYYENKLLVYMRRPQNSFWALPQQPRDSLTDYWRKVNIKLPIGAPKPFTGCLFWSNFLPFWQCSCYAGDKKRFSSLEFSK